MNHLFAAIGLLVCGMLIGFFEAKVLIDMVKWFHIPYLDRVSFVAMYGLISVKSLLFAKPPDFKEEADWEEIIGKIFGAVIGILLAWGFAYIIAHWIL